MKAAVIAPASIPSRRANSLQVMKMCQAMAEVGMDVFLAAPQSGAGHGATEHSWAQLAQHYGLRRRFPIEWIPAARSLRRYDYAWRAVSWAHRWGAQIVYTRLPQAAALAASRQERPVVFEIHDLPAGQMGPFILRRFLRAPSARRLVVISHALARDLSRNYGDSGAKNLLVVAPDGVDLQRYAGLPEPLVARRSLAAQIQVYAQQSNSKFRVERLTAGYTGHLYAGRGIDLILDLAAHFTQIDFLLVGGEPAQVTDLRKRIARLNLANVVATGFVPNADLALYQAACDLLLMPYQQRVAASSGGDIASYLSPMKLFEYMACGRPILSSDLPVLREILSDENAVLLPSNDTAAWIEAMRSLESDSQRRQHLGRKTAEAVRQYSWEARATRIFADLS